MILQVIFTLLMPCKHTEIIFWAFKKKNLGVDPLPPRYTWIGYNVGESLSPPPVPQPPRMNNPTGWDPPCRDIPGTPGPPDSSQVENRG